MTSDLGASRTQASLALTAFWAMVTLGRILFAAIVRWVPARIVFHALPIVLLGTFTLTAALPDDTPWLGVAVFGLAGLGSSALLPLTISLGQNSLVTMSAAVAGGVIAFHQVGYGIAAFGVRPLVDRGVSLSSLYGWTAVVAAAMALLSFSVAARQAYPRQLHPTACGPRAASRLGRVGTGRSNNAALERHGTESGRRSSVDPIPVPAVLHPGPQASTGPHRSTVEDSVEQRGDPEGFGQK